MCLPLYSLKQGGVWYLQPPWQAVGWEQGAGRTHQLQGLWAGGWQCGGHPRPRPLNLYHTHPFPQHQVGDVSHLQFLGDSSVVLSRTGESGVEVNYGKCFTSSPLTPTLTLLPL